MGFEDRRKLLIGNQLGWGDTPPSPPRSRHVPDSTQDCRCSVQSLFPLNIAHMNDVSQPAASRSVASISTKDFFFPEILKSGKNFRNIDRVLHSDPKLSERVAKCEKDGFPLIIEGLHKHKKWLAKQFHPDWLAKYGPKTIDVRNVHDWSDQKVPFPEFLATLRALPKFAPADELERFYGKDAPCPDKWNEWLQKFKGIPERLLPQQPGDLLSSSVETLMCYLGVGDTFTPCHKDLCASSGQNLMCYTENGGSSFWFMTKSSDAPDASKYFQTLKQELDHETHVITVEQLAQAPFEIYIAEQKLGDLVLVPPRSCHQVVNYGGITIKTSWSRMTLKGLETAYYHELPIYQRVCRSEIYRIKSTIHQALLERIRDMKKLCGNNKHRQNTLADSNTAKLTSSTRTILQLFDAILCEEYSPTHEDMHCLSSTPVSSDSLSNSIVEVRGISCDFCGADIFQSFFECRQCTPIKEPTHGDGFIICPGCYIDGRSCRCGDMEPLQFRPYKQLLLERNEAASLLSKNTSKPPKRGIFQTNAISTLETLYLKGKHGTFRAACELYRIRKEKKGEKVCSLPFKKERYHMVPSFWTLNCKKCNQPQCYTHLLLTHNLHAVDALLLNLSDTTHEELHRRHKLSSNQFRLGKNVFLQSQKDGSKPDLSHQRVQLALQYATCKPGNPSFMRSGWYDTRVQIVTVTNEQTDNNEDVPQDSFMSEPLSPLSALTSLSTRPNTPVAEMVVTMTTTSPARPLKRKLMDYVQVPSLSYKIKRVSTPVSKSIGSLASHTTQENAPQLITSGQQVVAGKFSTLEISENSECVADKQTTLQIDTPGLLEQIGPVSQNLGMPSRVNTSNSVPASPTNASPISQSKAFIRPRKDRQAPSSGKSSSMNTSPAEKSITWSSAKGIEKEPRLEALSMPPSPPSDPTGNTIDRTTTRSLQRKNCPRGLQFTRKSTRVTPRVEAASLSSRSSSSVYPGETTPSEHAVTLETHTKDTTEPIIDNSGNPKNKVPESTTSSDQFEKFVIDELGTLRSELKTIRQAQSQAPCPQPTNLPSTSQPQLADILYTTLAATLLGKAGNLPFNYFSQAQTQGNQMLPLSYIGQLPYANPASQQPEAYHHYQPSTPHFRRHWETNQRDIYHEPEFGPNRRTTNNTGHWSYTRRQGVQPYNRDPYHNAPRSGRHGYPYRHPNSRPATDHDGRTHDDIQQREGSVMRGSSQNNSSHRHTVDEAVISRRPNNDRMIGEPVHRNERQESAQTTAAGGTRSLSPLASNAQPSVQEVATTTLGQIDARQADSRTSPSTNPRYGMRQVERPVHPAADWEQDYAEEETEERIPKERAVREDTSSSRLRSRASVPYAEFTNPWS